MFKPQTSHFHRRVRISDVDCGISAGRSNVEIHLCNGKISCGTRQTYDKTVVRTVYGVHLRKQILSEHDVRIEKIYLWTNSSTVLQWLQAAHKKKQVFVANRAAEILEISPMDQWRHVKGVENPADIGTRGMSFKGLKESVWLNGPAWLQTDEAKWPKPWRQENELEPEQVTSTVATEAKLDQVFDWRQYSTFN